MIFDLTEVHLIFVLLSVNVTHSLLDMFRPHTAILSCYRILSSSNSSHINSIHRYMNCKRKLLQCNANIRFNKICLQKKLTPKYKHNIRRSTYPAHGWQHHIGENWHNRATASGGEYSITTEDGRVRPKHVKKWMCYIDGQKNKYSVLNECNRMLKYNILEVHFISLEIQFTYVVFAKTLEPRLARRRNCCNGCGSLIDVHCPQSTC
jgi:hypothetical protein